MRTQYSIAPLAVVASLVGACGDRSALHEGPYQSQLVAGPGISPFTVPNTVALNPDTAIAVGPQDIVQMTNSAIQVFDRNLAIVDGGQGSSMDLATFIRSSDTNIPTDPRIVYFYAPDLLDGGTPPPGFDGFFYPWFLPNGDARKVFAPQPAHNIAPVVSDSASPTYILMIPQGDEKSQYGANHIFVVRGIVSASNGGIAPSEDWADLTTPFPYFQSANYLTPDGGLGLGISGARLTNAVAALDPSVGPSVVGVWTQHTVAETFGGRAEVRWYEITIDYQNGGVTDAGIYQSGTVASADGGEDYYGGSLSPSISGSDAIMT